MAAEEQSDKIKAFEKQVEKWEIPEGDELLKYLKAKLCGELNESVEFLLQCKSMERLGSPKELSDKISSLPEPCFFYIGYTKAIKDLWSTRPEGEKWEQLCSADKAPVKTHTYFIYLNENETLTEANLIKKWREIKECLNGKRRMKTVRHGIVYVLVYERDDPRENVNRLCQKLKEGDLMDYAFRQKMQQVQEVLGI